MSSNIGADRFTGGNMYRMLRFAPIALLFLSFSVSAQQDPGPLQSAPPPPPRHSRSTPKSVASPRPVQQQVSQDDAERVPTESPITNEALTVPIEDIVKKFAEREKEFSVERGNYTYTQTFVIQTIDNDDAIDGEYRMTSEVVYTPEGKRLPDKVVNAPQPTLQRIMLSPQDLDDLEHVQPFVLTTVDIPKYTVTYVGRQKIDELATYVFDVAPKKLEKNQRYFQGRIWVDDQDLNIVKTDGKAVPDIMKKGHENVFPRFVTYRKNIEDHYWFPVYTVSDDNLHFSNQVVHIRMFVRYDKYKRFGSTVKMGKPVEVQKDKQ